MLTRRGGLVVLGGVLLALVARLLGLIELFMLSAAAWAAVLGGLVSVRLPSLSVEATRRLRPPRVPAGTDSRVELAVRNAGGRRSPVLAAMDPFDGGRRLARFLLAPLEPGETANAAYRLPTEARGVYRLGPLELQLTDPFGLARRSVTAAPSTTLTVFPRVDPIDALSLTRGGDALTSADHPAALAAVGEDFYALREYEVGDDLRRVHWKSSAKLDQLMIRQEEMPWQARAVVVLDLRPELHDAASLEIAVSAAASILTACWRRRSLVRLVATDGTDTGFGGGQAHLDAMLDHLAAVQVAGAVSLRAVLAVLGRERRGAALAVVTTSAAGDDLDALKPVATSSTSVTLVAIDTTAGGRTLGALPRSVATVRVVAGVPFATAWAQRSAGDRRRRRGMVGTTPSWTAR